MYHPLLPGETEILLAIPNKIFTLIQCITKRSSFKVISGHGRVPSWKDGSRFPYCRQCAGFPVSRYKCSVSAALFSACGVQFPVSVGIFSSLAHITWEQCQHWVPSAPPHLAALLGSGQLHQEPFPLTWGINENSLMILSSCVNVSAAMGIKSRLSCM